MKTGMKFAAAAFGLAMALAGASGASATTTWQAHHPRRAEVNARLARENHRIMAEGRDGELTRRRARDLRAEDRGIRDQERLYASRDHGHITRAEQRQLNREENGLGRQIARRS